MNDELVTFNTAELAKEKGFDELCEYSYEGSVFAKTNKPWRNSQDWTEIAVPTQSLLQRWLREKHGIHVFIGYRNNHKLWDSHAYDLTLSGPEYVKQRPFRSFNEQPVYDTFEEAVEAGLLEALNQINHEKII